MRSNVRPLLPVRSERTDRKEPASFLETVLEPALCAILRLHSALPSGALPALSSLLSSRPDLEAIYRNCSTAQGRQALRQAGQDSRRSSLGGFMLALREAVQREQDRAELERQDTEDLVEAELEGVEEVGTGGMERQERGGRGGKMSESLMSPAALALLVQNAQVLEDEVSGYMLSIGTDGVKIGGRVGRVDAEGTFVGCDRTAVARY